MRFQSIASGSNGNCIYIEEGDTRILVDAGISAKGIREGILNLGVAPDIISGILVTHAHSDHIKGLPVFMKHFHIPLYCTEDTLSGIRSADPDHAIPEDVIRVISRDEPFELNGAKITPIPTCHDTKGSCGYRIDFQRFSVAVLTDLGTYDARTVELLQGLNGLLIESNHDVRMLEAGPYPFVLKRRILGDYGHLSNERCAELLTKILHKDLKFILLGHISEENNYPEIALMTVKNAIDACSAPFSASDFRIEAASRYAPSDVFEL